jgi:uncharacterized protein (DUF302 family)
MNYGYKKEVNLDFNQAVEKVKEELVKEGFGILTLQLCEVSKGWHLG